MSTVFPDFIGGRSGTPLAYAANATTLAMLCDLDGGLHVLYFQVPVPDKGFASYRVPADVAAALCGAELKSYRMAIGSDSRTVFVHVGGRVVHVLDPNTLSTDPIDLGDLGGGETPSPDVVLRAAPDCKLVVGVANDKVGATACLFGKPDPSGTRFVRERVWPLGCSGTDLGSLALLPGGSGVVVVDQDGVVVATKGTTTTRTSGAIGDECRVLHAQLTSEVLHLVLQLPDLTREVCDVGLKDSRVLRRRKLDPDTVPPRLRLDVVAILPGYGVLATCYGLSMDAANTAAVYRPGVEVKQSVYANLQLWKWVE